MRVAIIAECFLPQGNGVTNSVLRVLEHLRLRGHDALVIAPGTGPSSYAGASVERVPAVELPFYRGLPVGLPAAGLRRALERFEPDVVHLAAPVVLGAAGGQAARSLGIPSVAVYQTDLAGFAKRYGFGVGSPAVWRWLRWVHTRADLTLAPSSTAAWALARHGITPVERWARGVDLERFNPVHRSTLLHRQLAPRGELVVGYVGRLAPEKQVHLLRHAADVPGVRVVVVGDGPSAAKLRTAMPKATFLGFLSGAELSRTLASLDVFVHTGADETFCQAVQEALASGVPVVAPAAGGPMDLVQHGHNGWLYPVDDPATLRWAVAELSRDPSARSAMGAAARASTAGRSWMSIGDELIGHYRAVIGGTAALRRAA